jgi:hypothetical protein
LECGNSLPLSLSNTAELSELRIGQRDVGEISARLEKESGDESPHSIGAAVTYIAPARRRVAALACA